MNIVGENNMEPQWYAWFNQLYTYLTQSQSGGGGILNLNSTINTTPPIEGGGKLISNPTISLEAEGVSNAYLAPMAPNSVKGNNTAATAAPTDISGIPNNMLATMLPNSVKANPTGISATPVDVQGVPNTLLAPMPASTLKGNPLTGPATPADLTPAQVIAMLNIQPSPPSPGLSATQSFLANDGQTVFTFTNATGSVSISIVALDGSLLYAGIDYAVSGANTNVITLVNPALAGQTLYAIAGLNAGAVVSSASNAVIQNFVGFQGQTAFKFTNAIGVVIIALVAVDGSVLIPSIDYTLSGINGDIITLFDPVSVGQNVYAVGLINSTSAITQAGIGQTLYPQTLAEIAAGVTPVNYAYAPGNIRRQGALVDGVTDDSVAIRSALDAVPLTGGRIFCDPPGVIMVKSVVYIPQRNANSGASQGISLDFTGCVLNGNGGQIFESGTGQYSTVAKGGATNWGLGNELPTTIHDADKIIGATLENYSTALKLFNLLSGCQLRDLYSESLGTMVYTDRSFYLSWNNINADCNGQPATTAIIRFGTEVNTMSFHDVHVAGGVAATGVGYQFDSGVLGNVLGLGAEDLTTGMLFIGEILGASIVGNYFENCVTAIQLGALSDALVIESNYVNSCATFINGNNWISGRLGHNHYDGTPNAVNLSGTGNICEVWIPPRQYVLQTQGNPQGTPTGHNLWKLLPPNWSVNAGCTLRFTDYIFNGTVGYNSPVGWFTQRLGGDGQLSKNYVGTPNISHSGQIPFCTTSISGTNLTVLTNIAFDGNAGGITFDIIAADNTAVRYVSGRTYGGTSVFRYDALVMTVTVSNVGGFFQFVFGNFNVLVSLIGGEIRLV